MIFYILDPQYRVLDTLDTFKEATWNVFFRDEGNCMLYLPAVTWANSPYLKAGNYLSLKGSDRYMILEDFETRHEMDEDPLIIVEGRSLEAILDRRVIWDKLMFARGGKVQDLIRRIVNENLISPSIASRRVPNFRFVDSADSGVVGKTTDSDYLFHGENVLTTVRDLCSHYDLGFRVLPEGDGGFKMDLYSGVDRSYAQEANPWVVFSPQYNNLESTKLIVKHSGTRNAMLVYNEHDWTESVDVEVPDDEGNPQTVSYTVEHHEVYSEDVAGKGGTQSGLGRRELFLESSKSHTKDDEERTMFTEAEYRAILQNEGKSELSEYDVNSVFYGKIEALNQFTLGKDFELGDIVQVENEYGMTGRCRVAEVIFSQNDSGERVLPYFANVGSDELMK